jgi:serine/threonine-protein kinase
VAHAVGVVHRDVKPSNIFLHRAAEGEVPKLLDFGIARIVGDAALSSSLTVDGSLFGTPAYMAPERFRRGAYGTKSDIYSLGTVLYEMLSGRLPFMPSTPDPLALMALQTEEEPPPLEQFAPDVPPGMERLVREALSPSPDNRPTADEFARRLSLNSPDTFTPLDDEPEA